MGDFWGSSGILKIELSRESELNPEGWGGSGIRQNLMFFLRPDPEPPQRHPGTTFLPHWCRKVCPSGAQWVPKSPQNPPKVVSGIHLVSPWPPDPPQGGPRAPKGIKIAPKSMVFRCYFQSFWPCLLVLGVPIHLGFGLIPGSCQPPRCWMLCLCALSGPFVTTGSGKRLLVKQLKVIWGPLQG